MRTPRVHQSGRRPETPAALTDESAGAQHASRRRWPWILGACAAALLLLFALFDWNLLRGPAERFATRAVGRPVSIGHLDVRMHGLTPYVALSDVSLANADWAGSEPMARAKELSFSVRPATLLTSEIVVPHLRISRGEVSFVRDAAGRANWKFRERDTVQRRNVRVLTIGLDDTRVTYRDAANALSADLHAITREEGRYATRIDFTGQWREARFGGTADTGSVVSLRGSVEPFPIRIAGKAGATTIRAEGEVADITRLQHIDADFAISGPSLASLYEALHVALPETPPYQARGRLKRNGDVYTYGDFTGRIGKSDIAGNARYELRERRPMLTADLKSRSIDVADLGPLIGAHPAVHTGGQAADSRAGGSSARSTRRPVANGEPQRVLPRNEFNLEKLNRMDADVRLSAAQLRVPGQLPFRDVDARAHLDNAVLTLQPLNFGFAGGTVAAGIVLDARTKPLSGRLTADLRQVRLRQLFPALEKLRESAGRLGAQVRLTGQGNSVAALLGSADGTITVGMAGGRVSEIAVWLVNLNGGELIPLLFGGDRPTPIRCAAAAVDVKNGIGNLDLFVFDTEESRIGGSGSVDLKNEQLDITLRPESKKPGVLSIRGPIHVQGPFARPHYAVAPQSIARGIGSIALGLVNPVLALLPLVETGQGEDANCRAVLEPVKGAVAQSGSTAKDAPTAADRRKERKPAPIANVPPKDATTGIERRPQAPIVEVAPKK